jgi:hypothetical protein
MTFEFAEMVNVKAPGAPPNTIVGSKLIVILAGRPATPSVTGLLKPGAGVTEP